jgi:hypothetical protein
MKTALSALVLLSAAWPLPAAETANPLYNELMKAGIRLPEGPTVMKLPLPLLEPGQVPKLKDTPALLARAAGNLPVDLFIKPEWTGPFSLKIESVETDKGTRCGQLINLSFVVYAKLEDVKETDFVKTLIGGGKGKKGGDSEELSPAELKQRGIQVQDTPALSEKYETIQMTILDKVQVDGVTRTIRTMTPHTLLYATRMDDRFEKDKKYPNTWAHINKLGGGARLGQKSPYTGLGGYVLVTELPEPKGALLVEMHYLIHEPPDWFGEYNVMGSKLPTPIRDNVRNFRRKVQTD